MTPFFIALAIGYLLGSIPSGYLIGRAHGVDLRREGSGNIGATNAFRVLGKKWGYTVFALDAIKGGLAIFLSQLAARSLGGDDQTQIITGVVAGFSVVLGNSFPVWLGFKGGKGIATSAGVMFVLFPQPVFWIGLILWIILFRVTRYVSIASIAAAISLPTTAITLTLLGQCDWIRSSVALALACLAIWRHKPNIERLMAGTEKKFERKPRCSKTSV